MKKLILIALVAISCAKAGDCRYEEDRLNDLIWQYDDIQSQLAEIDLREQQALDTNEEDYTLSLAKLNPNDKDYFHKMGNLSLDYMHRRDNTIPNNAQNQRNLLQERQRQINKRIKQAKQQLNNCRSSK